MSAGGLDLAIVSTTGRAPLDAYTLHHLLDESLYVAVPAGHPLAAEPSVRLPQLADADWISGTARPEGTLLDAALRHGFRPRVAHVVAEWTAKQGYVAAGLGVALIPALAAESVRPDIALLPVLDEDAPARAVYAATARGRSLAPRHGAFLGALREAATKIPTPPDGPAPPMAYVPPSRDTAAIRQHPTATEGLNSLDAHTCSDRRTRTGPGGGARGPTRPAADDPAAEPTVEELRLDKAAPQEILRRCGFDTVAPEFARALARATRTSRPSASSYGRVRGCGSGPSTGRRAGARRAVT